MSGNKNSGRRYREPTPDLPEQIQQCLSCPYPECTNCMAYGSSTNKKFKKRSEMNYFIAKPYLVKYFGMGMNGAEIAKKLGVDPSTVNRWRKRLRAESCK